MPLQPLPRKVWGVVWGLVLALMIGVNIVDPDIANVAFVGLFAFAIIVQKLYFACSGGGTKTGAAASDDAVDKPLLLGKEEAATPTAPTVQTSSATRGSSSNVQSPAPVHPTHPVATTCLCVACCRCGWHA